jgi:hypothetical protein
MERLSIYRLQEPNEGQFSTVFSNRAKKQMLKDGWEKGCFFEAIRKSKTEILLKRLP